MSALAKWLDGVQDELRAIDEARERLRAISDLGRGELMPIERLLREAAPLLRMVAEAGCDTQSIRGVPCAQRISDPQSWCIVCRITARAEGMLK